MKTAVVTGATSGIGLATVKELLQKGFFVIGVGRDLSRSKEVLQKLQDDFGQSVIVLTADLSVLANVKELSLQIEQELKDRNFNCLDALVNNAGCYHSWYLPTAEGFETQLAVNYLAPFVLTKRLLPLLTRSKDARVVSVSSGSHYRTSIKFSDINRRKHYFGLFAYKQSKLALVMMTHSFNKEFGGKNLQFFAADPGLVNTDIGQKQTTGLTHFFWGKRKKKGVSAEKAAENNCYLCTERLENKKYSYFYLCKERKPSVYSLKEESCEKLYQLTEKLCQSFITR